ncbi:MAG: hypothetical protein KKF80_02615, partial [Candidatus Omnitrophica bacterium]|nr:hypothetical protein [Candidatus Omnitrophota bacterium]
FIASLGSAYGFSIKEIPIRSFPRRFGRSHYNIRNRVLKSAKALLEVRRIKTNIKNRKGF